MLLPPIVSATAYRSEAKVLVLELPPLKWRRRAGALFLSTAATTTTKRSRKTQTEALRAALGEEVRRTWMLPAPLSKVRFKALDKEQGQPQLEFERG
jgi:hypothetical protein